MPGPALKNFSYTEIFAALGKFVTSKGLKDVCIMEFEDGLIVTGTAVYEVTGGFRRTVDTYVMSADEIRLLMETGAPAKRGIFGR